MVSLFGSSFALLFSAGVVRWFGLSLVRGHAWSFDTLNVNEWRSLELITIGAFIEFLFLYKRFFDFFTNDVVYFRHNVLLLFRFLNSLFHETDRFGDNFFVKFQLDFLTVDAIVNLLYLNREKVHHFVVPFDLLMFLAKFVVYLSNTVKFVFLIWELFSVLFFVHFCFLFQLSNFDLLFVENLSGFQLLCFYLLFNLSLNFFSLLNIFLKRFQLIL